MAYTERKDSLAESLTTRPKPQALSQDAPSNIQPLAESSPEPDALDADAALEQDYPAQFEDDEGDVWLSAEHYTLYHKALLMGDADTAHMLLHVSDAAEAKRVGRRTGGAVKDRELERVLEQANWLKFNQNKELGKVLLGSRSEERRLGEEGDETGKGEHMVERVLDTVRERLRKEEHDGKWPWLKVA